MMLPKLTFRGHIEAISSYGRSSWRGIAAEIFQRRFLIHSVACV